MTVTSAIQIESNAKRNPGTERDNGSISDAQNRKDVVHILQGISEYRSYLRLAYIPTASRNLTQIDGFSHRDAIRLSGEDQRCNRHNGDVQRRAEVSETLNYPV